VSIPAPNLPRNDTLALHKQWKWAHDAMRKKFEALATEHQFTLIRSDGTFTGWAFGTSLVIGPYSSFASSTPYDSYFYTFAPVNWKNQFFGAIPERMRTQAEDNTGNRYLIQTLLHDNVAHGDIFNSKRFVSASSRILKIWNKQWRVCEKEIKLDEDIVDLKALSGEGLFQIGISFLF